MDILCPMDCARIVNVYHKQLRVTFYVNKLDYTHNTFQFVVKFDFIVAGVRVCYVLLRLLLRLAETAAKYIERCLICIVVCS